MNNNDNIDQFADNYCYTVIQRIKDIMISKGISQGSLSTLSGIGQSTISKFLSGETKMTLNYIAKICKALSIDPSDILSFSLPDSKSELEMLNEDNSLVVNPDKLAFKGYLNSFHIYFNSTISSEESLLHGLLTFKKSDLDETCDASLKLYTGKIDSTGQKIAKNYSGKMIISLSMSSCYCILVEKEIGEMCFLIFNHMFLFNQNLICRMGCALTTSSGGNKRPTMHRFLISCIELDVSDLNSADYTFIKGQLKLNRSDILISKKSFEKLKQQEKEKIAKMELEELLEEHGQLCTKEYYCFDESVLRSAQYSPFLKAEIISLLRKYATNDNYNKISTKSDEYVYNYLEARMRK